MITLVLPRLAILAVNLATSVQQGIKLTLAQREAVHAGSNKTSVATLQAFLRDFSELRDKAAFEEDFHYKWYHAFHYLSDRSVAAEGAGLDARDAWTRKAGLVLPSVGVQVAMHRLARTDLIAQLAYQNRIRACHDALRRYYYPYILSIHPSGLKTSARRRAGVNGPLGNLVQSEVFASEPQAGEHNQ